MKVIALQKVTDYLERLMLILYEKEYFGFKEDARKYVRDLYADIEQNLPTHRHRPAPTYFDKYGKNMRYAVFKKNRRTHWYVFFRAYKKDNEIIYQIRYIGNNHTIAQYL